MRKRACRLSLLNKALKNIIGKLIPKRSTIFDFGCGTGELIKYLEPSFGYGYDPSHKMVSICKQKYKSKEINFKSALPRSQQKFKYIIMSQVVEHLQNPFYEVKNLKKYMDKESKLIICHVDTFWEPFLNALEKLHLKMPEGPNNRISTDEIIKIGEKCGLKLISNKTDYLMLSTLVFEISK